MNMMKTMWLAAAIAAAGAGTALAAGAAKTTDAKADVQQQIDMHEKMADVHKQFADCLRSGKSETDCRQQAMKDCPTMKPGGCAFQHEMGWRGGRWNHGKGMMRGGQGMQNESGAPGGQGNEPGYTPPSSQETIPSERNPNQSPK